MSLGALSPKITDDASDDFSNICSQMPAGSSIFHQVIQFFKLDPDQGLCLLDYWTRTPWIANVRISQHRRDLHMDPDRAEKILAWCHKHIRNDEWQQSAVTLYGWTWFGFTFKHQLAAFETFLRSIEDAPEPQSVEQRYPSLTLVV